MPRLADLAEAASAQPYSRVVHVTNDATAALLHKDAANRRLGGVRTISNTGDLTQEIKKQRYTKYVTRNMERIEGVVRAIASAPTATIEGVTYGLGGLASVDKHTAETIRGRETIFVYENSIDAKDFGKLLSFYSGCEASKMPTIVIAAATSVNKLRGKLAPLKRKFLFNEYYGNTSQFWDEEARPVAFGIADLITELTANNSLSVANSDFNLIGVDNFDFDELAQNLSAAYAVIRSVNFEYDKFASAELTKKAKSLLDSALTDGLSAAQRDTVGALRVLFILWNLYLYEANTEQLEVALSISESIGSDLLKAHCLRLINLSAGYSDFSVHSLEKAELIFRRENQEPMAIYCKNNALLNRMHMEGRTTRDFEELIDEAKEKCPTLSSIVPLINNAVVGAILDTRYERALEFIEAAKDFNSIPLHRIGLDVNALVCRFIMGQVVGEDELNELVIRLRRLNINKIYAYHQSIMLFNILCIQRKNRYSSELTSKMLRERMFMPYQDVLDGRQEISEFFADNLPTTAPQKRFKGQRGDFILRTNLIPIIHFGWM